MAISSKDIEPLWGCYQSEGVSKGVSVSQYFEANGISYHVFEKWLSIMKNNILDNCWSFMEIIRSLLILSVLISFAVSDHKNYTACGHKVVHVVLVVVNQ